MKANAMRLLTCVCLSIVAPLLAACTGCDDSENANDLTTTAQTTTSNKAATRVAVVEVLSRQYVETVDLPGASVHGFETTVLEAKVGGYVKQISQLANSVTGELEDVDIGSLARTGEVLAVLDAPEMVDDLAQTRALVLKAESEVAQAEAAIRQADAEVARDIALVDEARTERDEKDAFLRVRQADFDNQQSLHQKNATTRELVDKAKFQLDAAVAALASVDARIRTAEAMAHVADANREKAEADLTAAQAHVAVAQADMARTQTILDYAQIRAPFDGLITKRMVDHGAFVRPATSNSSAMPLFEITRTDRIRIEVKVPMSRAQRIRVGQPVIIHGIGGLPGFTAEGKITRSADALDQNSRMMNIQVHLSNPVKDAKYTRQQGTWTRSTSDTQDDVPSLFLQPGMYATVTILRTWDELAVVPTSAVSVDESGNHYVMMIAVENGENRCRSTVVDVVFNDANEVGISAGIQPTQQIIARDIAQLKDGQAIVVGEAE